MALSPIRDPYVVPSDLINRLIGVLTSDQCQSIDFRVRGLHITGINYRMVALAMVGGLGMRQNTSAQSIRVIAPREAWPQEQRRQKSSEAWYFEKENTFLIPTLNYGQSNTFQQMSIVHESTHAALDMMRARYSSVDTELAAYTAAMLYNLYLGEGIYGPGIPAIDPYGSASFTNAAGKTKSYEPMNAMFRAAHAAAWSVAHKPGQSISSQSEKQLQTEILKMPLYAFARGSQPKRQGDGLPL